MNVNSLHQSHKADPLYFMTICNHRTCKILVRSWDYVRGVCVLLFCEAVLDGELDYQENSIPNICMY